jgi:hypothetical protein
MSKPLPESKPLTHIVASMIVKNEANNLPDLFASCVGLIDTWVIVDTGSTDKTIRVAHALGKEHGVPVHVYGDVWDDDFSRSRNLCLGYVAKVCADEPDAWVFILDGDDRLQGAPALRAALEAVSGGDEDTIDLISLSVLSPQVSGGTESVLQPRLWPLSRKFTYELPVHMRVNIVEATERLGRPVVSGTVPGAWIHHVGYSDAAHQENNWLRALRIVRTKLPEDHPHRLYCEARSLSALGQNRDAMEVTERALRLHREGSITLENNALHLIHANCVGVLGGDALEAVRVLVGSLDGKSVHADAWFGLLTWAAMGYMAHAVAQAASGQGLTVTAHRAHKVLSALENAGVFPDPLPENIMGPLKTYAASIEALHT